VYVADSDAYNGFYFGETAAQKGVYQHRRLRVYGAQVDSFSGGVRRNILFAVLAIRFADRYREGRYRISCSSDGHKYCGVCRGKRGRRNSRRSMRVYIARGVRIDVAFGIRVGVDIIKAAFFTRYSLFCVLSDGITKCRFRRGFAFERSENIAEAPEGKRQIPI